VSNTLKALYKFRRDPAWIKDFVLKLYFSLIALMLPFVKKIGYFIYEAFALRNGSIDTGIVN